MNNRPELFTADPDLARRVPWVRLTSGPTRVHRLIGLGEALGAGDLWIKRDDERSPWYGGNKPRKLEFLLGAAHARGCDAVLTFGALGSNHALATALYGAKAGLRFAPSKLHAAAMAATA